MSEELTQSVADKPKKTLILPIWFGIILTVSISIFGILVYQNYQLKNKLMQADTTLSVPPTTAPTIAPISPVDPTANWKTYINTRYSFKYPQKWETQPIPSGTQQAILLLSPDKFMGLSLSLDLQGLGYECVTKTKEETITLDAQKVTKTTFTGAINDMCGDNTKQRDVWISISRDSKIDNLTFSTDEKNFDKAMEILDQILSTFKFIEPDKISCGGIAGKECPTGSVCKLDGNYPDAGGVCVKN